MATSNSCGNSQNLLRAFAVLRSNGAGEHVESRKGAHDSAEAVEFQLIDFSA